MKIKIMMGKTSHQTLTQAIEATERSESAKNAKHSTKFYYEQYGYKIGSQGTNFFEFTPYRDHYITVLKVDAARPLLY